MQWASSITDNDLNAYLERELGDFQPDDVPPGYNQNSSTQAEYELHGDDKVREVLSREVLNLKLFPNDEPAKWANVTALIYTHRSFAHIKLDRSLKDVQNITVYGLLVKLGDTEIG